MLKNKVKLITAVAAVSAVSSVFANGAMAYDANVTVNEGYEFIALTGSDSSDTIRTSVLGDTNGDGKFYINLSVNSSPPSISYDEEDRCKEFRYYTRCQLDTGFSLRLSGYLGDDSISVSGAMLTDEIEDIDVEGETGELGGGDDSMKVKLGSASEADVSVSAYDWRGSGGTASCSSRGSQTVTLTGAANSWSVDAEDGCSDSIDLSGITAGTTSLSFDTAVDTITS